MEFSCGQLESNLKRRILRNKSISDFCRSIENPIPGKLPVATQTAIPGSLHEAFNKKCVYRMFTSNRSLKK